MRRLDQQQVSPLLAALAAGAALLWTGWWLSEGRRLKCPR